MPVLQKGVAALAHQMPKVISPKTHAIADFVAIGAFGVLAGLYLGRNRRAAIAAMICGGAELTTVLLTDFPGGVADVISLPAHLRIDYILAATASALPSMMGFDEKAEAKWFRILGLKITAVAAMTEAGEGRRARGRRRAA